MSDTPWWKNTHPAVPELAEQLRDGKIKRRDFLRTTTLLGVSAAAAYSMAGRLTGETAIPRAAAQGSPKMGGNLRVSMFVKPLDDPARSDWSETGNLARHIVEPLAQVGTDFVTRPYLMESWAPSEDLKTWTLKLRKGIKWNNGDDFGAEDVAFNFRRWLDPATGSSNQSRYSAMTHLVKTKDADGKEVDSRVANEGAVEIVDENTVRLHLANAELAIPESLGDYPGLIVHRNFSDEGGDLSKNPVGTGAFELAEFSVGERAVLRRREGQHWTGDVYLDRITYADTGGDTSAEIAAFASGQIDINHLTGVEQIPAMQQIPGLVIHDTATAQTGVARFKVTEAPFDNKKLRQAFQAAIDHARLLDLAYQNNGIPGEDHHVSPAHPDYAKLPPLKQDIELAKKLLAEAGYPDGIEFDFVCVNAPQWEPNTCQAIVEMVKAAGFRINLKVSPGETYWPRWDKWPYSFTSWTHRALGTQVPNLAYRAGGVWNESSYNNPAYDALLDQAGGTIDVNERIKVMAKLEKILQDDAVITQPFWRSVFVTTSDKVRGFAVQPSLEHHYNKVWLDS